MKTTWYASGSLPCALNLLILLASPTLSAAPPDDNWYVGGPDGVTIPGLEMNETWHLRGDGDNDSHVSMMGKKITLRKVGESWFLIPGWSLVPDEALDWTLGQMTPPPSPPIPLKTHPGFNPAGSANQWRWRTTPPVWIADDSGTKHQHIVCVGFPDDQARPEDEKMCIAIKNWDGANTGCDRSMCDQQHPGHSNADR